MFGIELSDLDEAMEQQMALLVFQQRRPFSYKDFLSFEVEGTIYTMTHGTFRNKIRTLMKNRKVILDYRSSCAFYSLLGNQFGKYKTMTGSHVVVHNDPFYRFFQRLPLGRQSIHDIRLKFQAIGIWNLFSDNTNYPILPISNDIVIPAQPWENIIMKIYVHSTDVVSVILGCSLSPISLDIEGIMYFSNLLARIEERLRFTLSNFVPLQSIKQCQIPDYKNWVVTMWHFGRDSLSEYDGEKFSITVEKAQHILIRVYVKNIGNKKRIRFERQEYPNKKVEDIVEERLGTVTAIGD